MNTPALGLVVHPGWTPALLRFLVALRPWCDPRFADPARERSAAWLATSPVAPGLGRALASGVPVAVWFSATEAAAAGALANRVAVVVTDDPTAAAAVEGACLFPSPGIAASRFLPLTPFVRERQRRAVGFPRRWVADVRQGSGTLPDDLVSTALATAAAVVVDDATVLESLAWGAPTVCTEATAAAVGAEGGREVVVGDARRLAGLAAGVAGDTARAAALGRAGRRLVERRHDVGRTAGHVAGRLGLLRPGPVALEPLVTRLAELWTPREAGIVGRAERAVAGLSGGRS